MHATVLLGAGALGAVVLVGGVTAVALPGDPAPITACANKTNGALRLLTSGTCKASTETTVTWPSGAPAAPTRYFVPGGPSDVIADSPTRLVREAYCHEGDQMVDDQLSLNRLAGVPIDTLRVDQLLGEGPASQFGKRLLLETKTPMPDDATAGLDVVCLDTAAPFLN
jgi:hypothetical protein